jgi:hypothetical protein
MISVRSLSVFSIPGTVDTAGIPVDVDENGGCIGADSEVKSLVGSVRGRFGPEAVAKCSSRSLSSRCRRRVRTPSLSPVVAVDVEGEQVAELVLEDGVKVLSRASVIFWGYRRRY